MFSPHNMVENPVCQVVVDINDAPKSNKYKRHSKPRAQKNTESVPASNPAPPAAKKPTPSFRWANMFLSNALGEFAADIHRNGTEVVYKWNGVYWQEINDAEGRATVASWLSKNCPRQASASSASDAWRFGVMRLYQQKRKPEATSDFIIPLEDAYLQVSDNGAIHVIKPDQSMGLTHAIPVKTPMACGNTYTPKPIPCDSLLHRFLSTSLPDEEVRAFVQEQCAMSFVPRQFGLVPTWFGPPAAGKSTMSNIVAGFHARPSVISLHKLDESFGLEQILDSTLIQVDEVESKKWCEATFKSLATGDPVTVNRKHKTPIASYRNRAMIIMTSNHSPFVTDNSGGVYRRLVPVHWTVSIPEEQRIPEIASRIFKEEAHIFLDWVLEGVVRLMKRGRFLAEKEWPQACQKVKENIRYSNDHVGAWMKDCHVSYGAIPMPKEDVYNHFVQWCMEEGRTRLDPNVFWREVARRPGFEGTTNRVQARVGGKRCSVVSIDIGVLDELVGDFLAEGGCNV